MFVGVSKLVLLVPGAQSLKDKRAVLRRVRDRVLERFDCAISEVGGQDEWQRAELGVAVVGGEARVLEGVLQQIVDFVHQVADGRVVAEDREVMKVGEELGRPIAHWEPEAPNPPIARAPAVRAAGARPGAAKKPGLRSSHRRGR